LLRSGWINLLVELSCGGYRRRTDSRVMKSLTLRRACRCVA
jgi:hypothetical protein